MLGTLGSTLSAQTGHSLLVLSKRDHTLAIVDPSSLHVVAKMPVGNDPHEVIASSDGRRAYVSNYGFGAFHTLAVLDLEAHTRLPSIELGPLTGPHGLAFVGGKVWFTAEGAKVVGRYDPAGKQVDLVLGTGQNRTHMIYVSPDQEHLVTTNVSSGTVSMIDKQLIVMRPPPGGGSGPGPGSGPPPGQAPPPRMDWNETVIPVGRGSEGFDLSPDGKEIWVANAQDGTVSIIDRAAKRVKETLRVPVQGANRLKFTPDGKHVLVSLLGSGGLIVLDAGSRQVVKLVPIGHGAAGILIEPDGKRAFVACSPDNYVAVIDLDSLTVTGRIEAGGEPDGMAWATRR
jgi:YVTN family beta-propeller protein